MTEIATYINRHNDHDNPLSHVRKFTDAWSVSCPPSTCQCSHDVSPCTFSTCCYEPHSTALIPRSLHDELGEASLPNTYPEGVQVPPRSLKIALYGGPHALVDDSLRSANWQGTRKKKNIQIIMNIYAYVYQKASKRPIHTN